MEKLFIPYEQAVDLKNLGFKEECLGSYLTFGKHLVTGEFIGNNEYHTLAPLWLQAFDWFRKKYDINGEVQTNLPLIVLYVDEEGHADEELQWQYNYRIILNKDGTKCDVWESKSINTFTHYDTYEEARLECLKKLIEIAKKSKRGAIT